MSATVTPLRTKRRAAPPAAKLAEYAPPFPVALLAAMARMDAANSTSQRITRGNFTTAAKAHELPRHLRAVIAAAEAALQELEGRS